MICEQYTTCRHIWQAKTENQRRAVFFCSFHKIACIRYRFQVYFIYSHRGAALHFMLRSGKRKGGIPALTGGAAVWRPAVTCAKPHEAVPCGGRAATVISSWQRSYSRISRRSTPTPRRRKRSRRAKMPLRRTAIFRSPTRAWWPSSSSRWRSPTRNSSCW